jgi:predicted GIY-YIG superfamily endonuclease
MGVFIFYLRRHSTPWRRLGKHRATLGSGTALSHCNLHTAIRPPPRDTIPNAAGLAAEGSAPPLRRGSQDALGLGRWYIWKRDEDLLVLHHVEQVTATLCRLHRSHGRQSHRASREALSRQLHSEYVFDMLVYYEEHSRAIRARMREKEIKGWRREKKLKLILGRESRLGGLEPGMAGRSRLES